MSTPTNGVNPVTSSAINAHSEQALTELIYIQEANNLIESALGSLDNALTTTTSILNILQALQNMHNDINVSSKSAFNFNYQTGGTNGTITLHIATAIQATRNTGKLTIPAGHTAFSARITSTPTTISTTRSTAVLTQIQGANGITTYNINYNNAASAYFGQDINPYFVFSSQNAPGYAAFQSELQTLKSKLEAEEQKLTKETPAANRNDPTSLLGTIKAVLSDMPTTFNFASVEKWALDNYTQHGSTAAATAGNIENDITTAITAAESLNDTQKERVRSLLFIFEEYYQSAAAILTTITQVIEQEAQKISQ